MKSRAPVALRSSRIRMKSKTRIASLRADALEFSPGILRVQAEPPAPFPRALLYIVLGLFVALLLWAVFGRLDIVAVAQGKLVPQSHLKIVQPSEPGILQEILVKEGQQVAAGQVLMRMNPSLHEADTKSLHGDLQEKRIRLRRIDAELSGTTLVTQPSDSSELFGQVEAQFRANRQAYEDALDQERAVLAKAKEDLSSSLEILEKLKQTLPTYQAAEAAFDKLAKQGYAGNLMALDRQRQRVEKEQELRAQSFTVNGLRATIEQSERKLQEIASSYRQQLHKERVETFGYVQKLEQEWAKQQHRNALLELKAPQGGIVKDLATHTPGTVVSPGTILMTLVPQNEPLQAEVWVENEDVGFVQPQLQARTKLAAYPFQKYGMIDGVVSHVSADATDAEGRGGPGELPNGKSALRYKAVVSLKAQALEGSGEALKLAPGMQVSAEILLGQRSVLDYLLSPVQKAFSEAARER